MSAFLCRDEREIDFGVRRFRLNPGPQRTVLETAAGTFVAGFNAAIRARTAEDLAASLGDLGEPLRGHALEGAGMAATVLDLLTLRRGRRLKALLAGPGRGYPHLVYAGAGRAYASLRMRPSRLVRSAPADRGTHPALRWLAWDGYGFHRAFFAADQIIGAQRVPRRLTAEQRSVFDQGVGRALWFHECADPDGVALRIAEFDPARRASLWSGAGLAATYAGGADVADLGRLAIVAGRHRADLAHGSALACAAGAHAGLVPAHMAAAAHAITGALAEEASGWVSSALSQLGQQAASPAGYRLWREEICARWAAYRGPAEAGQAGRRPTAGSSTTRPGAAKTGAALAGFADLIEADLTDTADLAGRAGPADPTQAWDAADAYVPPQSSGAPASAQAGTAPAGRRPGAGRSGEHER